MKKIILIAMMVASTMVVDAQISRPSYDGKVNEFTKLVTSYTSGQRVDKTRLSSLYMELNCVLTEPQSEALDIDLANTREDNCGSSEFPRTQSITDATFKKYAESVKKYLSYGK